MTKLTAKVFDAMTAGAGKPAPLWGAKAIGDYLGIKPEKVRAWAKYPNIPIYQPHPRCYFADRRELDSWLRTKVAA